MSEANSTPIPPSGKPAKPHKPYPEFPLFPHASGQWAKKIRGKLHYFGRDPETALASYLAQKDDLHAGRKPSLLIESVTVKDVANAFLKAKLSLRDNGELTHHTWMMYQYATKMAVHHLGKSRQASDLGPEDFAALRKKMAARWRSLHGLGNMIQCVRSLFKHAHETGLLPIPIRFGPQFRRPAKRLKRIQRAEQGPRLFTASEIRGMIAVARPTVRAMILLGINCGLGNTDCGKLPLSALDINNRLIDFPRPKTGVPRRCALWPETIEAIEESLQLRPQAKRDENSGLVFLTHHGSSWAKDAYTSPLVLEMRRIMTTVGMARRNRLGFYTLRHTFRTVADETKDQPAVDFIMGHEVSHMSSVYRETISDDRLQAVADYVRNWLFHGKDGSERAPDSVAERLEGGGTPLVDQPQAIADVMLGWAEACLRTPSLRLASYRQALMAAILLREGWAYPRYVRGKVRVGRMHGTNNRMDYRFVGKDGKVV